MQSSGFSKNVFIVAGEESANQYALKLIHDGKDKNIKYAGVGFKSLEKHDFDLIYDAKKLSVMGGVEVLKKYSAIKDAFKLSSDYILQNKPDVILLIDFGGFNLRLAKKIKQLNPSQKIYYFISPKFWAWRESRVTKVKKWVDKMFVIHPFEVEFYKKHGYSAVFVGHPLNQELKDEHFDKTLIDEKKEKFKLKPGSKSLCLLFGSREAEIEKLLPEFLDTAAEVLRVKKDLNIFTVVPPSYEVKELRDKIKAYNKDINVTCLQADDPMDVMCLADVALVASGTATLQLGLLEVPMAIGYKMNPITMYLAKKLVKGVKYAGLVNILSGKEISKEFLQEDLKAKNVAKYLIDLIDKPDFYQIQKNDLSLLKKELGKKNPYEEINYELSKSI